MSNKIIRADLETKLTAWQTGYTPEVDLVLEGEPYVRGSKSYIESFLMPAATVDRNVSAIGQRYVGIWQLNVWCKDGDGTGPQDDIVQSLIQYFPVIPKSGVVSVDRTPYASASNLEDGYRVVYITIRYRYES